MNVLVNAARARASLERGGDGVPVPFDETRLPAPVAAANVPSSARKGRA